MELSYCEECGGARVAHPIERWGQTIESWFEAKGPLRLFFLPGEYLAGFIGNSRLLPHALLRISFMLSYIGLMSVRSKPRKDENTRTLALYEGAEASGVSLYQICVLGIPAGFVAKKDGDAVAFSVIPRPRNHGSPSLQWMDDKGILKAKLRAASLPTAKGGVAWTEAEAVSIFHELKSAVIAKPYKGSRGRHTTLNLSTEEAVRRAYRIARMISIGVIVEEYLPGSVHRVTLVGGKPVAIARRDYPYVIGDGERSIHELIEIENQNPMRDGIFFRNIPVTTRTEEVLKDKGYALDSIPEKGVKIFVNDKNSRLNGTVTEDVTDATHPDNLDLFRAYGTFLQDPIVGIDFIIEDIARSYKDQPKCGLLECNSMPFIDVHHKVVSGRTINVAKLLWDEVFK